MKDISIVELSESPPIWHVQLGLWHVDLMLRKVDFESSAGVSFHASSTLSYVKETVVTESGGMAL